MYTVSVQSQKSKIKACKICTFLKLRYFTFVSIVFLIAVNLITFILSHVTRFHLASFL